MKFYEDQKTANQYIEMAEGFDGRELIEILRTHLSPGDSVLELGMGPGVDLDILKAYFSVTGSDTSSYFLERYREKNPDADLIYLDAVNLNTHRVFDCLFSNKVLHHLSKQELAESVKKQHDRLNKNGLVMHSFWLGEGHEEHHGMRFEYHTEESLRQSFADVFEIIEVITYTELDEGDSLYLLAKADWGQST